jgi:hypothetical protein
MPPNPHAGRNAGQTRTLPAATVDLDQALLADTHAAEDAPAIARSSLAQGEVAGSGQCRRQAFAGERPDQRPLKFDLNGLTGGFSSGPGETQIGWITHVNTVR